MDALLNFKKVYTIDGVKVAVEGLLVVQQKLVDGTKRDEKDYIR